MSMPEGPLHEAEVHRAAEEDRHTAAQRRINLIWEYTQATIAISIVLANIVYIFLMLLVTDPPPAVLLANAFFLVIGFYFGRTNHARIGDWGRPLDDRSEGSRR
jgi:hypothetical protein